MKWIMMFAVTTMTLIAGDAKAGEPEDALSFKMKSLGGKTVDLKDYRGKVVLMVNTASECGLTPHYEGLQSLYEKYSKDGLVVLGFPCNQFGGQEPGTEAEIAEFCKVNYGVTFPMFAKVDVNGDKQCDLYRYLTALDVKPKGAGKVSWNFEKFIVGRDGKVVARYNPRTTPADLEAPIKEQLGKK